MTMTPLSPEAVECPGCNGAEDGCCICDHTGKVWAAWLDALPVGADDDAESLRAKGGE